jgi:multiple sugar transport system ATP-binding protein
VRRNLEFPLRMQKLPRAEIARRVALTSRRLNLIDLLERKPRSLSGGQRQRVAMGRAIVRDADVFLMDEPLSNLDARLRVQIRSEIAALQARLGITTIYVTHDQVEAMTLGQRVAVMQGGKLQQVAPPQELYERPANVFVAGFIGSPGMNVLRASLESNASGLAVRFGHTLLTLTDEVRARHGGLEAWTGRELLVGIRPEFITLAEGEVIPNLTAHAHAVESLGHATILHCKADIAAVPTGTDQPWEITDTTEILIAILSGHRSIRAGEALRLHIEPSGLHFFTLAGEAIR